MPPSISCVIPCYNAERYIAEALDSLCQQTPPPEEIILVDDGSTDKTVAIARSLGLPQMRIVQQDNQGPALARNAGIKLATGDLICLLDSDDQYDPACFSTLLQTFAAEPALDAVFGHWKNFWIADLTAEQKRPELAYLRPVQSAPLLTAALFRRAVFDRHGLFTQTDTNDGNQTWLAQAQSNGLRYRMAPKLVLHRRIHHSNYSRRQSSDVLFDLFTQIRTAKAAKGRKLRQPETAPTGAALRGL